MSWWLAPEWDAHHSKSFLWPPRLVKRLNMINAETKYLNGAKEILIEMSRWKEAILNTGSEPISPGTPFPLSILDELNVVWEDRDYYRSEETEDAMIAKIEQWRKAKEERHAKCRSAPPAVSVGLIERTGPKHATQESSIHERDSDVALVREAIELRTKNPRSRSKKSVVPNDPSIWKKRLRTRTKIMKTDKPTSWRDRLQPTHDVLPGHKIKAVIEPDKPKGIIKEYGKKASKKTRQLATQSQNTTPSTQEMDELGFFDNRAFPTSFRTTTSTKSKRPRRSSFSKLSSHQPQDIRKARSDTEKQVREAAGNKQMTKYEKELLHFLTSL